MTMKPIVLDNTRLYVLYGVLEKASIGFLRSKYIELGSILKEIIISISFSHSRFADKDPWSTAS